MKIFDAKIVRLIRFYLSDIMSGEQQQELEKWLTMSERNRRFFEEIKRDRRFEAEFPEFCDMNMERGWSCFEQHRLHHRRQAWKRAFRWAAVIMLPLALGTAVWLMQRQEKNGRLPEMAVISHGEMKAVLELPEGTTLVLNTLKQKEIVVGEGLKAIQTREGLRYDSMATVKQEVYNTLKIPRGGEFRLMLSDGTHIILNSATELKYPVVFGRKERQVFLDGEAYFEVATDSVRPFRVTLPEMTVQVYGTSFNINTHRDRSIQTVLVEGKVGITPVGSHEEIVLKPGELASFDRQNGRVEIRSVDARQYTAWTRGIFTFEDESLEQIMNTLSLWYDVEVFYQTESARQLHFSGHLERYSEIRNILDMITETTGVKFSIKGRTIVVL